LFQNQGAAAKWMQLESAQAAAETNAIWEEFGLAT